jgi:glutamine amidotransferase-like uncharacterized protein
MKHSFVKPLFLCALLGILTPIFAQTPVTAVAPIPAADPAAAPVTAPATVIAPVTAPVDPDAVTVTPQGAIKFKVVAPKDLWTAPVVKRPLKIAVYWKTDTNGDAKALTAAANRLQGAEAVQMLPEAWATADLSKFDIVIFPGGSGSSQAKLIGEGGLKNVQQFVKNGGSYLGICAGAYLATSGYPWSLGFFNAKTKQPWARGNGAVSVQLTDEGKALFGKVDAPFPVFYNGGPMIEPDNKKELSDYKVLAYFRDEVAPKPAQVGQMKGAPAIVTAKFGKGTVLTISPHFESTRNMENFLPNVLEYLGENTAK